MSIKRVLIFLGIVLGVSVLYFIAYQYKDQVTRSEYDNIPYDDFPAHVSCTGITYNNVLRAKCYSRYPQQMVDVNSCFKIKTYGNYGDGYWEGECVTGFAIQNKDVLVCNQIDAINIPQNSRGTTPPKDICVTAVAIATNNSALCDSLNSAKNTCYGEVRANLENLARQTNNSSLCTGAPNKKGCYLTMGFDFKNYFSNFDFFLFWSKTFLYHVGILLAHALVLYSYYRQIKNRVSFQFHISKLTIVGLIATVPLGISEFLGIIFSLTSTNHPSNLLAVPLLLSILLPIFSALGALMIFKKPKPINT